MQDEDDQVTVQLDVQKLLPISRQIVLEFNRLTGLEQGLIFAIVSWSVHADKAEEFLDIAKSMIPQVVAMAQHKKDNENV